MYQRLYGRSTTLATTTTATTAMEVKKTAAAAGKRNDRGDFRQGVGGDGEAEGKHTVSLDGLVASWLALLVRSAKEQQRIAQGLLHRGGGLELELQRLAHAELQMPESGAQGGIWELRNGRRLRSAKRAPPAERATALHASPTCPSAGNFRKIGKKLFVNKKNTFFKWGGADDGTRHCLVVAPKDSNNTDPPTLRECSYLAQDATQVVSLV